MGDRASSGFTIIEVILFLAVTGALIVGMMVATSLTLGVQRYRDATESFKTLLQDQYANLTSIQNSRDSDYSCNSQAAVSTGDEVRGQSNCVLLGKYMIIRGGDVTIYPVLGYTAPGTTANTNDITSLRDDYALNIDKSNPELRELEWESRISWITATNAVNPEDYGTPRTNRSIALLFVRAPGSGQIYTFSSNTVPAQSLIDATVGAPAYLRNMVVAGATVPGQKARTICLDSGGLTPIPNTSISIAAFASSSSSIEVRSNDVANAQGVAARC